MTGQLTGSLAGALLRQRLGTNLSKRDLGVLIWDRHERRRLHFSESDGFTDRAHTNGVVQQSILLRRLLETGFEKVLRRVRGRCLAVGFNGKKGSEKGS